MNKKLNSSGQKLVDSYNRIVENILAGKTKYAQDKGKEPSLIVVHTSIKKIVENMEFFSDHVLVSNGKRTIIHGMELYSSNLIEQGEAIYGDSEFFNVGDSYKNTPTP